MCKSDSYKCPATQRCIPKYAYETAWDPAKIPNCLLVSVSDSGSEYEDEAETKGRVNLRSRYSYHKIALEST